MATRIVEIHDKCKECGKLLHSIREGERGQCSSCWLKAMPADTKRAVNKLIASAFNGATDSEKGAAVTDAMEKLKRDEEA